MFQFFGLGRQDPVRYHGGSVALRVSSERYASLWAGPKSVLRLNLGEWSGRGLLRLLLTLRELKTDRHIEGVLVVVNGVSGGWGKAFELRQALLELRKSGNVDDRAAAVGSHRFNESLADAEQP